MKPRVSWKLLLGSFVVFLFFCGGVSAQQIGLLDVPVKPGERLSDWLLRNAGADADTTALHWQVWAERAGQTRLKQAVLSELQPHPVLQTFVQAMPLTGRLQVAIADARWLQASPGNDPVLQEGHRVRLFPRPNTVRVLSQTGQPCIVSHQSGARALDYLQACWGQNIAAGVDWAWIVQSDGIVQRYGVAIWNREPQAEPGPGAWVWAPDRNAGIDKSTSDNLARFLATQEAHLEGGTAIIHLARPEQSHTFALPDGGGRLTASDWGEIGVLQTPTARMMPAGDARLQISRVWPYTRGTVMLQPMDWLEAGFRYTDTSNRLYGPEIAGTQSYKDKSLDFKIRVTEETAFWPQTALGIRDLGGTGFFSGEYLVASKRWGDWDLSLGLGWGYLSGRGQFRNPLALLGSRFDDRSPVDLGQGGIPSLSNMFKGRASLFGGVQWQAPDSPWSIKAELDGNDYQREPQSNNQVVRSRFNLGASYAFSPSLDLSIAVERGTKLMVGVTFHGGLNQLSSPKPLDPDLPRLTSPANPSARPPVAKSTGQLVEDYTGWRVESIHSDGPLLTVAAEVDGAPYLKDRIERAVAVLNRDAAPTVERIRLILMRRDLSVMEVEIDRAEWLSQRLALIPPSLRLETVTSRPVPMGAQQAVGPSSVDRSFAFDWAPSFGQVLGGPDGFVLYQFGLGASIEKKISANTWFRTDFHGRLFDNYDQFKYDAPSNLPRVRTDLRKYALTSRLTMPVFQLTHMSRIGSNQYIMLYGGMLESMYGGVGADWMYRSWHSPISFGINLNRVRQRDYAQNFAFRDYSVNTGHASISWDTRWHDVQMTLSAGQYLAGDRGFTLDVRKVFANGASMGAWVTKTNVSAEQFGEGSFDKGIYLSVPLDAILPKSSSGYSNFVWRPLTRDGGAVLARKYGLGDLARMFDSRALSWEAKQTAGRSMAQDYSKIAIEPASNLIESLGTGALTLARQSADIPSPTWLWAGGAVLASSLIDERGDRWFSERQGGGWSRLGSWGDKLPIAMALGTGLLYTGLAGSDTASTAETSLKAGAYAIGASLLTRYVVGRQRPYEGQGPRNFHGLKKSALDSGFPSNHVALAFALATPFAQKNNVPWAYGLAGLSALGRMQSRDHWLSDVVAGGLLGYAIGTLVGMQPSSPKDMRLTATKNSVAAHWPID